MLTLSGYLTSSPAHLPRTLHHPSPCRSQAVQQLHREKLNAFRQRVAAKCATWADKIAELKQLNEAAGEGRASSSSSGVTGV